MDNTEVKLLATVTANYLFLGQFETFRASVKNLLHKDPDIAITILQAIVQYLGDIPGVLWSKGIASPSHLAWRSFSELSDIQSENEQNLLWGLNHTWFRCKLEALLLLQQVIDVVESKSVVDDLSAGIDSDSPNAKTDFSVSTEGRKDISQQQKCTSSTILSSEEGLKTLKFIHDGWNSELSSDIKSRYGASQPSVFRGKSLNAEAEKEEPQNWEESLEQTSELYSFSIDQMQFLQSICTLEPELMNSICWNLAKQKKMNKGVYPSSVQSANSDADQLKEKTTSCALGSLLQKKIQEIFLSLLRQNLENSNVQECLKHLRFLHHDFGLDENVYRNAIFAIVRELINRECTPHKQDRFPTKLLELYECVQASGSARLVSMIESAQDSLLNDAIESSKTSNEAPFPPPLSYLHQCYRCLRGDDGLLPKGGGVNISSALQHCLRQLCHFSWITGKHMFDIVMSAALCCIKAHEFQKAVDVLSVFPRLQPLAAVIGWDLLAGDTSARRQMMEFLWIRCAPLPLEKHGDELCCVDHLCDQLCYRLDLAYYAAHINSGQDWTTNIFLYPYRGKKNMTRISDLHPEDAFVANLTLERLAMHSPIRVLFDVVPDVDLTHARTLLKMCPAASPAIENMRMQDLEIIEIHFGIQATVLALAAMGGDIVDEGDLKFGIVVAILEDLRGHIQSILNIPRRIFFMSIIIDLLHMDDVPVQSMTKVLETKLKSRMHVSNTLGAENHKKMTPVFFVGYLLNVLQENIPSSVFEHEDQNSLLVFSKVSTNQSVRKAWEMKLSNLRKSVEDWEWRLSVLQRLELSSQRQWKWKEAMAVLRAAPSTLLNMCVQRAQYDLGEEAIHRFELPPEDEAALQLAEWVDGAVARATVEDVVSRVAEGASTPAEAITFAALRAPLAPLASALLCIDVAAASARAIDMSKKLLQKARTVLAEATSLNAQLQPSNQPEHIQEACILIVSKRVGQCLQDLLEKVCIDKHQTLQSLLSGLDMVNVTPDSVKQGHRFRAFNILQQTIEDAHSGKRMFLSGKLHNLVKALADEDVDDNSLRGAVTFSDRKPTSSLENGILLGCGMRSLTSKQPASVTVGSGSGDHVGETTFFPLRGSGKRFLGPLSSKPFAYLSAFILYVATIGDIVDGVDTTHDFNFFSLVYERSNDLLTRLVFERGNASAAGKVSEIMGADLAHEIITACVPPVYPPKSPRGWACVPLLPSRLSESQNNKDAHSSGLYPLKLDVVKHLVTLSPVRAILACVFGTSIFREGTRNGSDRTFHEFALDQSDRFPTLNRWIQNQNKLQNLSDFPVSFKNGSHSVHPRDDNRRTIVKRNREHDSDPESEEDEEKISDNSLHESKKKDPVTYDTSGTSKNSLWFNDKGNSTSLVVELENESIYEETVNRLVEEGKLVDALAIADRHLRDGAPDYLLQLLIEKGDDGNQWQAHRNIWKNTWQYCIRLRDKRLAATLALKNVKKWDLDAAIDVLTMCTCHIKDNDSLYHEVLQLKCSLQLYSRILRADGRFNNWQEVESLCQRDPEELALRLAGKGAVSAALEVAENYGLRSELRWELQGRQLVKLLTSDPINGGGPAEALRFLGSLQAPMDALPVAMAAMEQLPSLRSKQLLVHFFLKKRIGALTDEELDRLHKLDIGLRILGALPVPWQQRCGALHEHPQLILETLFMWKQISVASELLSAFPSLRNDELILRYATKAISTDNYRKYESRLSNPTLSTKGSGRAQISGRSSSGINQTPSQKEVKRQFTWLSKDSSNKIHPRDANKKRKSASLSPSQKPAMEFSGLEERTHAPVHDALERLTPFTMTEGWVLTGDPVKDEAVRESHRYEGAPCFPLFKALLELCSSEEVAVKSLVSICIKQMKQVLSSEDLPRDASSDIVERAFHATEAFVQALLHAKVLLRKLLGSHESATALEAAKENNNGSDNIRTFKMSTSSELPENLSELLVQVVDWLSRAELIQSLLSASVPVCLDDVLDRRATENLRDRLIQGERYSMAVYCCTKCKVDAFPVWRAWAHALVQMEHYPQARAKLKQALKLLNNDPKPVVRDLISTMEMCPPVDVSSVRSLYDHMEKNASTILDDSLSADAYLNVLYMPSSFTKSERSRRSSEDSVDSFAAFSTQAGGEEGPRSNLDRSRYEECIFYLQEYARQDLLDFMFKHCRYADACLLFFPPKSVPPAPQPAQGGKLDPLLTEYGSIDDLCDICVAYGAMPVLERVIATRELSSVTQDPLIAQHTAAALTKICSYCENHKHFNHLYRFQVLRKDHVAAGLCCIQLFLNSSSQDQAIRHLERAKTHFDEGYHLRLQGGDASKGLVKVPRGKSPSERFSDEELAKFSSRVSLQMEVVRCFSDTEGQPWKHSLFGNPNDADTFRRRVEIVEALTERNFELAFRIILDFELPAVQIYAAVAATLAERRKGNQLTEHLKNIKPYITDDDDLDQVILAAIMVFAKLKERPDRLIEMLSSNHRKVLSCVACGRLKTAFQIASRSGSIADVQYVSDQAKRTGSMSVVDMCKQWLSRQK